MCVSVTHHFAWVVLLGILVNGQEDGPVPDVGMQDLWHLADWSKEAQQGLVVCGDGELVPIEVVMELFNSRHNCEGLLANLCVVLLHGRKGA